MTVLFVFVDGVGLGRKDPGINPFARARLRVLDNFSGGEKTEPLAFDGRVVALDATMGMEGRPQSATGQTALLTGLNAARENGGHLMGFTNSLLRGLLAEHSVLRRLRERGRKAIFANAFRPIFFLMPPALQRRRLSATTVAALAAALPLRTVAEIPIGEALYHDFTNRGLLAEGHDLPLRSPQEAARALASLASRNDFVLYEYFQTDKAGHAQDWDRAIEVLEQLDQFLETLLDNLDLAETTVLLASDHGNVEDLSHGGHTLNPALGMAWGRGRKWAARRLTTVMDVAGVIMDLDAGGP
ncbi:MAG: alkaline phosphatase family protein [Candidatus Wallbacteria bacterium]|nr:alkaline phosphatase family protein [Candidatus Wallbacteria bacterium]